MSVESHYPQLDLETLAIDFGLWRFCQYLIELPPVIIITDHKTLVVIFSNNRHGSVITDSMKLHHQDIYFEAVWRKGNLNPSDYLPYDTTPFNHLSH